MRVFLAAGIMLLGARTGVAAEVTGAADEKPGFFGRWIVNRLTIGARITQFWLEDTRRSDANGFDNLNLTGNFLGSLWGLDARQHYFPNPFVEYRVISAFGVGVAYDQARAKTLDWGNAQQTITAGDGDVEIRGLQFYGFGRYRNRTRLTPYASVGFARYWSHFLVSPDWALPGRRFEVDDTSGWFFSGGCSVALVRHLGLEALYRHSQVEAVSGRAYFNYNRNRHRGGAFPMRNDLFGAGLSYAF
jgi:opacity protein-like surface antigen